MTDTVENLLKDLRGYGWHVAVHNDYRELGGWKTFWLFTHSGSGRFVKGEAETDVAALSECLRAVTGLARVQ